MGRPSHGTTSFQGDRSFYGIYETRCINLDWLEVYAVEPVSGCRDADYYRSAGYLVTEREYGTRVYLEMFTLEGSDGLPLLEIRRAPKSSSALQGILDPHGCHIRLVNRSCYFDHAAAILSEFIERHGYTLSRITRVDICLDFERFDSGDLPREFLRRYLTGKYAKINQANISAHGTDAWDGRTWNSVSWGTPKSQIGTKFYNKTQELAEGRDKPYIRHAWFASGLTDHPTDCIKYRPDGSVYQPEIWRVEFSIRSSVKGWFIIEQDGDRKRKRSIRNTLQMYDGRPALVSLFASLSDHYFNFKHYERDKRKDRCRDKALFEWKAGEPVYSVEHPAGTYGRDRDLQILARRLGTYRLTHFDDDVRKAIDVLMESIHTDNMRNDLVNPFSKRELEALRLAISRRITDTQTDALEYINRVLTFFKEHPDDCF